MAAETVKRIHVVAAVIEGQHNRILVSKRADHAHQGGLWEFPGGKVEPGESEIVALDRELREELGLNVVSASPLIRIHHDYPDKSVILSTWRVHAFAGEPHGRESQPIQWIDVRELSTLSFPEANHPIVRAAQLPGRYHITPDHVRDPELLKNMTEEASSLGGCLFQLRVKTEDKALLSELLGAMRDGLGSRKATILVNSSIDTAVALNSDGVHLSARRASQISQQDLKGVGLIGVSCHSQAEITRAESIAADFVLLSPVRPTSSHPDVAPLGWKAFSELTERATIPVYALGGLCPTDMMLARTHGAQGIAGISGFWHL